MNDKVKRNIWLALSLMSVVVVIDRAIRLADGSIERRSIVTAIVIMVACARFYLCYRKQVKNGSDCDK